MQASIMSHTGSLCTMKLGYCVLGTFRVYLVDFVVSITFFNCAFIKGSFDKPFPRSIKIHAG